MYKFVRSFKKKPLNEEEKYINNNNNNRNSASLNEQNETKTDLSNQQSSDNSSSLSTLTTTTTTKTKKTSKTRHESFMKIRPNNENKNSSTQSVKVKRSSSHQKKNTTSSDKSDNQSLAYRSQSTSSLTTLSSTTITKETQSLSSSSSSSLTTSLHTSNETLVDTTIFEQNDPCVNNNLLHKLEHLIRNENQKITLNQDENFLKNLNFEAKIFNNSQSEHKFINIIKNITDKDSFKRTFSIPSEQNRVDHQQQRTQSLKMVLSDRQSVPQQKPVKPLYKSRNRANLNLSSEDEEKTRKNSKKNVNFRILKIPHQQQQKKNSNGSFSVIAQQPVQTTTTTKTPANRIPVLINPVRNERFIEISSSPRKRVRSPSNHVHRSSSINSRDFNSLLNLAHRQSHKSRMINKITIKPLPRSLSVNYLYRKRQGDLRRYQKNALIKISLSNRSGFTTEDIDDLYMPKQLDMFERKLKASLDVSDNSEVEDSKMRHERISRYNKRIKQEIPRSVSRPKIIINYRVTQPDNKMIYEKKSYLEEAKRKLDLMKNSKGYYYNLNNKLKSSVTNLIRASHDLARTSEIKSKLVTRNSSLREVYDLRRTQIRSDHSNIQNSFTCEDLNVYTPWMIENHGRKLAIEAMRRRANEKRDKSPKKNRNESPYVSQYYAKSNEFKSLHHNDLWLIDRDIRRYVKKADSNTNLSESEISMTDTETSSDDTRPIVPEKINKPDISLKNKILKAINKSLLSSEMTGIDLNILKLNDCVRRTLKRVEKKALERDLEHDLIRSFSCSHLADVRKEDIKYMNMNKSSNFSYSTEDVQDLYIPRILENYKLKLAVEKERKNIGAQANEEFVSDDHLNEPLITTQPQIHIKSPSNSTTPMSPHPFKTNTDSLFKQIIQERLIEFDHRMASEISSSAKRRSDEDAISTDNDQDDSIEISSDSDDLNMNEDEMKNFDSKNLSKSKIESTINKSLALKNPGELISDFYISNMNFAMRYSVEYIQQVAKEMRRRRQLHDSMYNVLNLDKESKLRNRLHRSFSVDKLYAVRREHLRYSNGAENSRISFTTDDIQDIYMPSCVDNYKRKIAVEMERRRRFAEMIDDMEVDQFNDNLYPVKITHQPVILDDLDIFIIKKSKFTVQENLMDDKVIKSFQPEIHKNQAPRQGLNYVQVQNPPAVHKAPEQASLTVEPNRLQTIQVNPINFKTPEDRMRFERANISIQKRLSFFENYPVVTRIEPLIQDEPMQIDQANVLIENFHTPENFPLVNKVNTLIDNELLQENLSTSSESMTSSISGSNDSLSNLNLDAFEPKGDLQKLKIDKAAVSLVRQTEMNNTIVSQTIVSNSVKVNETLVLEKPIVNFENLTLKKANVSRVKPMSMASQQLEESKPQYSKFIPPEHETLHEANYSITKPELKSSAVKYEQNVSVLNAPEFKNEQVKICRADSFKLDSAPVSRPEYFVEEYAKKSFNSEIVIPYENLNPLELKKDQVQKANVEIPRIEFQKLDSKKELKPLNAPKNDFESQIMDVPEQFEISKTKTSCIEKIQCIPKVVLNIPASVLIPVDIKVPSESKYEEFEIMEFKPMETCESSIPVREETLKMGLASVTEFRNVQNPDIDELSFSDADSLSLEPVEVKNLKQEKVNFQVNPPIGASKTKVLNLPQSAVERFETNLALEFVEPQTQLNHLEAIESVQKLEACQPSLVPSVLNLARQDSFTSVDNRTENILSDQIAPESAVLRQEILTLNSRPSVQKLKPLNFPLDEVVEETTVEDLEFKNDFSVQQSSWIRPEHRLEPLTKPIVPIQPVLLNSALNEALLDQEYLDNISDRSIIEPESVSFKHETVSLNKLNPKTITKHLGMASQSVEDLNDQTVDIFENEILMEELNVKDELNQLNSIEKVRVKKPIKPLYLGDVHSDEVSMYGVSELNEPFEEVKKAEIGREESINFKVEEPTAVEIYNGPVISRNIEEFLESVKPLDTIELDFEEKISINTRRSSLVTPNEIKVSIKQSFGKPEQINEVMYKENCAEFKQEGNDIIEPMYRENKINLLSPTGLRVGFVEKIGYAKVETSSLKSEELSELRPERVQKLERLETEFEPMNQTDRLENIKSQVIFNSPLTGQIKIETLEQFVADGVGYEKTGLVVQDKNLANEKLVSKVQSLNAPKETYDEFQEEYFTTEIRELYTEEETKISDESLSECNQKVGIDKTIKYNLATINENNEKEETSQVKDEIINLQTVQNTTEDNFTLNSGQTLMNLKNFARSQEIIEIYQTHNAQEFTQTITTTQTSQIFSEETLSRQSLALSGVKIRNLETVQQTEFIECQNLMCQENEQCEPVYINEPLKLVNEHNKSKIEIISTARNDELNESLSSLESFEYQVLDEAKADVSTAEHFNKISTQTVNPFSLHTVNEMKDAEEDVVEFVESLNVQSPVVNNDSIRLNEKVVKQSINFYNLPVEEDLEDPNSEIESFNEDSVKLENSKFTHELKELTTIQAQTHKLFNVPFVQNLNSDDSEADEFDIDNNLQENLKTQFESEIITQLVEKKGGIKLFNLPQTHESNLNLEQVEQIENEIEFENLLESKLEAQRVESTAQKSKIMFLNAPQNEQDNQKFFEEAHSFVIEDNTETTPLSDVKNELNLQSNKTTLSYLNAPQVQSESYSDFEEAHSFEIEATSQMNLESVLESQKLNTEQLKSKIKLLNAPKFEQDSLNDFEEADLFESEQQVETQLESKFEAQSLNSQGQVKSHVQSLNAPKLEQESLHSFEEADLFEPEKQVETQLESKFEAQSLNLERQIKFHIKPLNAPKLEQESLHNFEEVDLFEPEKQVESQLESKLEAHSLNLDGQVKSHLQPLNAPKLEQDSLSKFEEASLFEPDVLEQNQVEPSIEVQCLNLGGQLKHLAQSLNAPIYEDLSQSYLEDADSFEVSEFDTQVPLISQAENEISKVVMGQKVNLLSAPRPELISLVDIEEVENFEIVKKTEQTQIIQIENETVSGVLTKKLSQFNAPKIEQVTLNFEDSQNFERDRSNEIKLTITQTERSQMDSVFKNFVNFYNAPSYQSTSHCIERAESFETNTEMVTLTVKNEITQENFVSVHEPVRVLLREMEDAIEYSFNEGVYFENQNQSPQTIEIKRENNFLNNKPDKKLLLWLNYPKFVQGSEEEEAKKIDEKLDYLYEKVVEDIRSESSLEIDSNLVQIEKVLSLFISNQDHVEYHEEALRFLPNSRPELQNLIFNHQIPIEFEKAEHENVQVQVEPKDLSFDEDSIEEMSKDESKRFRSNLNVELDVKERIKSNSRVVFNMANLKTFFCQEDSLRELSIHNEPCQINKITHQVILKAPSVSSVEQKFEQTWQFEDENKEIPIMRSQINWDDQEGDFFTSTQRQQKTNQSDDENTLSIHTEDDACSFFEHIEKYEIVENKVHSTVIEEHHLDISVDSIGDKVPIDFKGSDSETDSTSMSETSGKMHLIESVEVLTHQHGLDSVQIQKIDINRLKIKEKNRGQTDDPKSRFKVNFKQEELLDLVNNEGLNVATNREFAKKFVEQIINLSASKLETHLSLQGPQSNCNFDCIKSKNTNEILETLSNFKGDLSKHFADSLISECGQESHLVSDQCLNMNLMEDVSEREEFFENFSNRLHSSSNYGNETEQIEIELEKSDSKDKEVVEILAQIVKHRTSSNCSSDSEDSLDQFKKAISLDSMQSFLDNVVNAAKNTINSKIEDLSDQDDETSIQEMVIFNQRLLDESKKKIVNPNKYKINTIKSDTVDDITRTSLYEPINFESEKIEPINGASIIKIVEQSPGINDFDETVEIVDSVVIDHVSEDDKSTTSEEVTFERWTEETKLIKTKIYKDGNLVDEIIEQSSPELVGNILREKVIERHEHIKHISQDVKKRVRVKSPGQSRRQSLDIQEILNEDLDGSSIIIVEPTVTSIRPVSSQDNTYYIQHQQVITPMGQTSYLSDDDEDDETKKHIDLKDSLENLNENLPVPSKASNLNSYFGGFKAVSLDDLNKETLIVRNDETEIKSPQVSIITHTRTHIENETILDELHESLQDIKNKSDSIVSNTDSFGSIQRYERPSKLELQKIQKEKQNSFQQAYFYEETISTLESDRQNCDKTIEESTFKGSENSKKDDLTDLSDEEHNIFLNNSDQNKSLSSFESRSSYYSDANRRRNPPLRRESFELAQRDPSKRLSIAKSTTSSSSSSFGTHQIIIKPAETPVSSNKRLLSEIRPSSSQTEEINDKPVDESKNIEITPESDSSESDILKRNYEILRKKTSEKVLNETKSFEPLEQPSFVSSHSIKSETTKPSVRPTKIKIVKKQKLPTKDSKFRSVSPGLLRGPDVIETIHTTTSMSFIMNKSINLVTEEKVERNDSKLKSAISQPQLNKIETQIEPIKSTPIPIQVLTRSRSEPKIKPEQKDVKITYKTDSTPRVTFHKYDSNEIIAVVNVPQAIETKTVESVVENFDTTYDNTFEASQLNSTHSKSTPNLFSNQSLRSKFDSWKKWPEYTVDQETDTSINNDYTHCWIKETPDSRVVFRNHRAKDKDPEFEIEIEKILPVHDCRRLKSPPSHGRYSTHSIINTNTTQIEETVATRMSSGYFSGDEFKSQMLSYSPNYSTSNFESPRSSSAQFNINKFLNGNSRIRSKTTTAFEEFNKLYESLGLEQDDALLDRANARDYPLPNSSQSSIRKLISNENENYSDYYYKQSVYSRKSALPDSINDDMSRRSLGQDEYLNKNILRDDASVMNRKRSSSMSNLNNDCQNSLILPSPTTADYLRNRTRESALINVVMKPAKTTSDFEISQILYDDMAYRQLRKDSEAHKLTQMKANKQVMPNNLTNITTLPISYAPSKNSNTDFYQSSNSVRTIKMIKQKDATNKSLRQNRNSYDQSNRYFTNEANQEMNDYYDSLNHVKCMNRNYGNY